MVPSFEGRREPLCAAYARESLEAVRLALGEGVGAVWELIERLPEAEEFPEEELRRFGEPELLLMNVNSPGDLERARASAGWRRGG